MKIHIAQKGDTLWNIAKKYNISFEQLEKANSQLSSPGAIYPGMKIKVPVEKVPVTNQQNRQDPLESAEEEQLEVAEEESLETSESTEEEEEEFLARSDEPSASQIAAGVPPTHETQLNIEEIMPTLPSFQTIPKPPFSLPVAPPPPIVNTSLSGSYGNNILQKQTESTIKQTQLKKEQAEEETTAPAFTAEQQKEAMQIPTLTTFPKPQLEYTGDVTQGAMSSQGQSMGYMSPAYYGKDNYSQSSFQGVQGSYLAQQPYTYGGGIASGYLPKAPCGCGGTVPQTSQFGAEYIQGVPYAQGHPYGYPLHGAPSYGYPEYFYGYPAYGVLPYEYQEPPYAYPGYGVPYGYGVAPHVQPYPYYAPPVPAGYQQYAQAPYQQAQDAAPAQTQAQAVPTSSPIPAYPFPTTSFQGQGYPDYYRDEANTNFGVPPIDEED